MIWQNTVVWPLLETWRPQMCSYVHANMQSYSFDDLSLMTYGRNMEWCRTQRWSSASIVLAPNTYTLDLSHLRWIFLMQISTNWSLLISFINLSRGCSRTTSLIGSVNISHYDMGPQGDKKYSMTLMQGMRLIMKLLAPLTPASGFHLSLHFQVSEGSNMAVTSNNGQVQILRASWR